MSGDNRGLPQDVTFTNITQDQVRSLEATFTKSAAFDGAAVSFREQTQADGSLTLSVHFMPLPGTKHGDPAVCCLRGAGYRCWFACWI